MVNTIVFTSYKGSSLTSKIRKGVKTQFGRIASWFKDSKLSATTNSVVLLYLISIVVVVVVVVVGLSFEDSRGSFVVVQRRHLWNEQKTIKNSIALDIELLAAALLLLKLPLLWKIFSKSWNKIFFSFFLLGMLKPSAFNFRLNFDQTEDEYEKTQTWHFKFVVIILGVKN